MKLQLDMRRFTRLTNGFSKKLDNFVRIHQMLRVAPAMAAGVTDRVFEISDIVKLAPSYKNS